MSIAQILGIVDLELANMHQQINHNLDMRMMQNIQIQDNANYEQHIDDLNHRIDQYRAKVANQEAELFALKKALHETQIKLQAEQVKLQAEQDLSFQLHSQLSKQSQEKRTYQQVLSKINGGKQVMRLVSQELNKKALHQQIKIN